MDAGADFAASLPPVRPTFATAIAALTFLVAACGGSTSTTEPATPPLPSPAAPGSASIAPNAAPALPIGDPLTVRVVGDGPVIEGGVDGPEGYPNDYPGAIVRDADGTYHCTSHGSRPRRAMRS